MAPKTTKSSRTKPANPIASWDDADSALTRIAQITRAQHSAETRMNQEIDLIKKNYGNAAKAHAAELKALESNLKAWCDEHANEFGQQRSRRMTHGVLSYRRSVAHVVHSVTNTIAAIRRIFARESEAFIQVEEKLRKDALSTLTETQLAEIGVVRKEKDEFGYTVDWEKLP